MVEPLKNAHTLIACICLFVSFPFKKDFETASHLLFEKYGFFVKNPFQFTTDRQISLLVGVKLHLLAISGDSLSLSCERD